MATSAILVNGLPGSGKTTLATALAPRLGVPLIRKDAIKEALAEAVPGVPPRGLGRASAELMWELAAAVPGGVVLESWWFRPRDAAYVEAGLRRCASSAVVEVWCDVPAEVARDRYVRRRRAPVHQDDLRLADSWAQWAAAGSPLGLAPVVRVPTDRPVDVAALAQLLAATLNEAFGT